MAISYPVNVADTKWAVYQVSSSQIIGRRKTWPVADGSEIPGLDPDFVYLLETADARPDYDGRIYRLEGTDVIDVSANTLTRTWQTIKRVDDEIKVAAENVEAQELAKHISLEREAVETRLMVGAILQYIEGLQMPPKVDAAATVYKDKAVKLWKNRDRLKAIIAEIEAGTEPDMDSGWEAE